MRKLLFMFISGLFLISCEPIPGEKVQVESGPSGVKVEKLFTVDGITVYRFRDGSEKIYFTNSTGVVKYETDDGDGNVTIHRTICNGKIQAEDPKN